MPVPAEFVQLLSSEANNLSEKEKKSTLNPEHILAALEARAHSFRLPAGAEALSFQSLGFSAYTPEVREALLAWKADEKAAPRKGGKAKANGMSEEEAIAAQEALFAQAREKCYGAAGGAAE